MNISLKFNNQTGEKISPDFLYSVIEKTLREADEKLLEKQLEFSVAAVDKEEMAELNYQFRNQNNPTDILSFGDFEDSSEIFDIDEDYIYVGEIVLCCDIIKKDAKENQVSFEKQLVFVVSHGILHLLGFEHSDEMFQIQDKVTESFE